MADETVKQSMYTKRQRIISKNLIQTKISKKAKSSNVLNMDGDPNEHGSSDNTDHLEHYMT
jgi:hypothetical protein